MGPRIGMDVLFTKYSLGAPFHIVIFIPSFMRISRVAQNLPGGQTHVPHKPIFLIFQAGRKIEKGHYKGDRFSQVFPGRGDCKAPLVAVIFFPPVPGC